MDHQYHAVDERTSLTSSNKLELLLFRVGSYPGSDTHELLGINVFKVREIMTMPTVTPIAASSDYVMGAVDIRGQIVPVINLPKLLGCNPSRGLKILLVTEFARNTQAFAVEEVDDIVRLDWNQVLCADVVGGNRVTSIARIDGNRPDSRLAQIVDVEQVVRDVFPAEHPGTVGRNDVGAAVALAPGVKVLAADDSGLARDLIAQSLSALEIEYVITKTGQEAWDALDKIASEAARKGKRARDSIALVLTDLEMPEMDGFTLTRKIKADDRMADIPVLIHSSLTGEANEVHVRNAGASGYVAKFAAGDLAGAIRKALASEN